MNMCHIFHWNYVFLIGLISVCLVCCHDKKSLLPQLVDNIVENEIARKVPAVKSVVKKASKRNKLTGSHMKAATDAINKLVDESIVNRVEEAEREVSQMLLKNIEHHIQDAGKIFIAPDEKGALADSTTCRDKLDGCDKLAQAGVCKTSRDAMRINCRHTCNYCHVVLDPALQSKLSKELETHNDGKDKVLSIKWHPKVRHKKHHRKHRIGVDGVDKLATDEIGMLGEEVTHHDNPSLEHEKAPVIFHHRDRDKDMDEAEKLLATERKLKEAKELERIKDEANRLLAAHKKAVKQKELEKQREEAERLLATEKKIKEEEQKELEVDAKAKQEKKKHMHKKKKQMVHKTPEKGKKLSDDESIPFLNEEPYPLTDFVSEYDKTSETETQQPVTNNTKSNSNELNKKDRTLEPNNTETVDDEVTSMKDSENKESEEVRVPTGYDVNQHSGSHLPDITEEFDDRYSPKHLILKYQGPRMMNSTSNSNTEATDNTNIKTEPTNEEATKKHDLQPTSEKQSTADEPTETFTPSVTMDTNYNKINNEQTGLDDADIQRHLPMLSEKDIVLDGGEKEPNNFHSKLAERHEIRPIVSNLSSENDVVLDGGEKELNHVHSRLADGHETTSESTRNFVDTNTVKQDTNIDIKDEIQTMIDKAFGEVLSSP